MLTLFLIFNITTGALTLYEGDTIGRGANRGGDTAQEYRNLQDVYNFHIFEHEIYEEIKLAGVKSGKMRINI